VKTGLVLAGLLFQVALGVTARAAEPEPSAQSEKAGEESAKPAAAEDQFRHRMQGSLRAGLVAGYRMILRYDKSPYCHAPEPGKDPQKFCGNGAPLGLDLGLGLGAADFAEPYLWARLGLSGESSTHTSALKVFGVGARLYTSSDSRFKVFIDPAVGVEVEGAADDTARFGDYKTDLVFHLGVGPQYDFARYFGAYVNFGLTTGVLRYIHTEVEGSLGVQFRAP
jgi:hypothetical protein